MYMVFVEVDRKDGMLEELKEYILDIENISGQMKWQVKPLLSDDTFAITDPELKEYVITDPDKYQTKEEFEDSKKKKKDESIVNFLKDNATIQDAVLENNILSLKDYKSLVKTLESMRGSLNIIPINKHIVFHNPATDQVLIARPC